MAWAAFVTRLITTCCSWTGSARTTSAVAVIVRRRSIVVGINGSKEAIDLIKADRMLATGEFNGFVIGCLATEIAAQSLRKQPVPQEVILKPVVYDKTNFQKYEGRADMRECPTLEDEMKN